MNRQKILDYITIDGPWPVRFSWDAYADGMAYVSMHVERADTLTGEIGTATMRSRTLPLDPDESTLVRTAFGLYVGFSEHEAREAFQYVDRRVFGPHTSVAALWRAAEHTEG